MDLTSGYPFWPIRDGIPAAYPLLDADIRCDAVVLGAGITGAMIAHALIDAGFDTVVVDRREVAWGSTAASTGLLQYEIDVPLTDLMTMRGRACATRAYLACRDAVGKLERLARTMPADVGFERKKSLYLAARPEDSEKLRAECDLRREIGIDVDFLSESDIGASPRGVKLVAENGCSVRARYLVFATGYETRDFFDEPVAKLASTYAVASEPLSSLATWGEDECLIWESGRPYLYLRTTSDHRVVVGGEDEPFRDAKRRDRLLAAKTETLAQRMKALFPDTDFRPAFAWTGTFGDTHDGLAYIGAHRRWPSSFFALCYGGNGITYGMLAAEIVRDALRGRPNDTADLFRFDR